ncbi:MAG: RDD family protein [Parasulfuritortus sp.]|jgi:uncharacterized RDD family membrane protein YckC|nr:RDD family protein [Parasulfuritortus sp.]
MPILMTVPTIKRRLICLIYEALLFAAVLLVSALLPFMVGLAVFGFQPNVSTGFTKWLLYGYWFVVGGFYLTWFWGAGGQTLAMKTWRIHLVDISGGPVSLAKAWQRYTVAALTFGACFIWAAFDRDRQFLHDRLAGTRLVMKER